MTRVVSATSSRATYAHWHLTPAVLALGYPWYLARFYDAAAAHHALSALAALAVVLAVPASAFVSLYSLGRQPLITSRDVILQRLAHFTFASPPLFVIVGVFLYLMKINGADARVWLGIWAAVLCAAMLALLTNPAVDKHAPAVRRLAPVRVMHGVASAAIILVFLFPHLGNHAVGILGADTHKAVMLVLRHLYRAGWIEPILIALFVFQIVSGLVLLLPKLGEKRDLLGTLQTASGAYLVIFIASHINAVFVLARYFGTDTDYAWATGLPGGLIADSWDVRLIPHYALGVWLILSHIVCGLRTVMLAHGVSMPRANAISWTLIGVTSLWAAVIVAGMVGVRI
ncbi:hypothetical protein GCT13_41835 [Paraburkholderia sp. CNPSo 3157]|uniref:Uncharacterized protein n=1 Tax=Paraburkholderia franconis TaxID=2654983 RepID=A0A7X1TL66_9BURK|nr:hypothetical protein [Paraburkholderia franconis]MPW23144.1 hypothetical protein [Paraburkholderia franconis]